MGIDFSAYLDLNAPPPEKPKPIEVKQLDQSKYKKKKTGGIKFDYGIGDPNEFSSETTVVVTEVVYREAIPIIITEEDIDRWLLFGSPFY